MDNIVKENEAMKEALMDIQTPSSPNKHEDFLRTELKIKEITHIQNLFENAKF